RRGGAVGGHEVDRVQRDVVVDQHAQQRQMPDAALAGAGGGDLARVLLDVGEQILGDLPLGIGGHGDARAVLVHLRDGGQVLTADVGQALVVHHPDLHGDQADGLAVGVGVDHRLVPDHTGAAGAVDHVDVGADLVGQLVADQTGDAVGATAGGPGHDHLHRARGIVGVDVVAGLDGVVIGSCLTVATGAADSHQGHGGGAGDAGHETAGTGGSHDGITPLRRAVRRLRRG